MPEPTIIQTAEFNPRIKSYILLFVAFMFLVSLIGIPFILIWLIGPGQYFSRRYYENLSCRLTDRHLIFKKGVMVKVEKTIPLENIQDLTFIDNPLLRLFDLRILKIETAGHSNPQGSDMKLVGIINSAEFKQKVLDQRERLSSGKQTETSSSREGNEDIAGLLKDIKDLLTEIRDK